MAEILGNIWAFVLDNILAIIVLVIVIIRTGKTGIMFRFDQQDNLLIQQTQLLQEQNMTLLRLINKVESILETQTPEKSEKFKELFDKQRQLLEDQSSLLAKQNLTLADISDKIGILSRKNAS